MNTSPYTANRKLVIAGTDMPAVDDIRGQGGSKAFSQSTNSAGDREINASSKQDMVNQISAMRKDAQSRGLQREVVGSAEERRERGERFAAAFHDKSTNAFEVTGEVLSDTIWETLNLQSPGVYKSGKFGET